MNKLTKALLVLLLEIVLLVPTLFPQKLDRGVKTVEEYWTETGLDSKELETILTPESCYSEEKAFLSCVNAISAMAERYNLGLNYDGELIPLSKKEILVRITEKKELKPWIQIYRNGLGPEIDMPVSFLDLWKSLLKKYVRASEKAAVVATGINGFLSIYKDPHTYIIPLAYYEEVVAKSESTISHVGFISRRVNDYAVVRKVYESSPAEMAGLKKGDKILKINGIDVSALHPSQFADILKLKSGDRLGLLIERNTNGKINEKYLEIIKSERQIPNVVSKIMNFQQQKRRIGILTLHKFAKDTCAFAKNHLKSLLEQGIQGLLVDLRDNPGGQVEEAACIINMFVARGTQTFETRYLDLHKPIEKYVAEENQIYRGPLAVLINSGSASASEIVAGSLKDLGRATLVGERTFGKGTFQDGRIWGSNQKIALFETEGMYYFPSGWTPQLVGLEPDINVTFNNADVQREDELFFSPLRPFDSWNGPQSLTWLQQMDCDMNSPLWKETQTWNEDPQIQRASDWLYCKSNSAIGAAGDRNGSL
jgi:carboxyl-terminal processing protease